MVDLLKQIWLVLLLALVFGVALAFTEQSTASRIDQNRRRQIRELAQKATLCELTYGDDGTPQFKIELVELTTLKKEHGLWAYKVLPVGGPKPQCLGYAVVAEGIGWDRLRILIGLSADLKQITGLEIVESRETPGLGQRIEEDAFRRQYKKPTDKPLELVKGTPSGEYQVQALTGATISSTAVTNMVNDAVQSARKLIRP